jgi:hypothetical protein
MGRGMAVLRIWGPAVLALVLFAAAAVTWHGYGSHADELRARGVGADATVVSVTMSAGDISSAGVRREARYFVTYRFMDSVGTPREGMSNGRGSAFADLAIGDTVAVLYLPNDPSISIYDTGQPLDRVPPVQLVVLLVAFGALAALYTYSGFARQRRSKST